MITNEKQFKSSRALLVELREALSNLDRSSDVDPRFIAAQRSALISQAEELDAEISAYEALRSGAITSFPSASLHDLPDILIRARIARGMSQKDLGDFLGLKEQQIQRYEADRYRSASLERLIDVADALHVQIDNRGELAGLGQLQDIAPDGWRSFPIAEMFKRGWFEDFAGTLSDARKAAPDLLPSFFDQARCNWASTALHRRTVRSGTQVHEPALAAWEARVRTLAERMSLPTPFDRSAADADWIGSLVQLSAQPDGPVAAKGHLSLIGIALVIEPHLPGTLLDGAAMRSSSERGIVGMTLRHDRLDNFWFTLLHEIGHLKLHIGSEVTAIFDDTESPAGSALEAEADQFAQEALLPQSIWHSCMSRFTRTEKAVLADAARLRISPAIIAGRIRREAQDYTLLRGLVGSGEPRRQLAE